MCLQRGQPGIEAGSWVAPRVMASGVVRQWCVVMDNGDCGQRRVAGVEYERVHLMVHAVSLVCASDSYAASGASSLIFSTSLRYLQSTDNQIARARPLRAPRQSGAGRRPGGRITGAGRRAGGARGTRRMELARLCRQIHWTKQELGDDLIYLKQEAQGRVATQCKRRRIG